MVHSVTFKLGKKTSGAFPFGAWHGPCGTHACRCSLNSSSHLSSQHSTAQRSRRNNESTEENITCLSFPDNPILNQQNAWETIFFKNAPTLCAQPTCLISLVCPSVTLRCLSHLSSKLYCTVVMLESEQRKKHVTPTHGLCPAISRVR